jgi:hypothetical protein
VSKYGNLKGEAIIWPELEAEDSFSTSIREEKCSRDSAVGTPITPRSGRSVDRIAVAARDFSLIQNVQIIHGALVAGKEDGVLLTANLYLSRV